MLSSKSHVTFVHDWLVTFGGGEQILFALMELWPQAPINTLVYDASGPCKPHTTGKDIRTSFIQKLPGSTSNHRRYLPLMPLAVEQFDLQNYDIVISCSHAVSHGIIPQADQLHINYICIPMRYAWHLYYQYLREARLQNGIRGWSAKLILHYLRVWDANTANRIDEFVAISNWVAKNVWRVYRRKADVIYPPVDVSAFSVVEKKDDFYITISRLVPYKKLDLIVESFTRMPEKKLIVIGDGPDMEKLKSIAGHNIDFLGYQPFEVLRDHLERAKAFVYAAVEDFGIVPVEAQACGTPVIAFGKGGVLETVIDGETGVLFPEQTVESLITAIESFENNSGIFNLSAMRNHAERFSKERFQKEFSAYVEMKWEKFNTIDNP